MKQFLFIALGIALAACSSGGPTDVEDYSATVYVPEYATGFTITGDTACGNVMITTTRPWQNCDSSDVRRLVVLAPGSEAAAPAGVPAVQAPVRRVVALSTTHIGLLDAFGADSVVVGVSGTDYVSNPKVKARLDSDADVGYEGNIDYERLLALRPDVVLLYGVNGPSGMEDKLDELSIPYIYIGDYTEESPLGKAEWMVPLGYLVGGADEARVAMEGIAERYLELRDQVSLLSRCPTVMLNTPYNDTWFMPSMQSYFVQLLQDAGAIYIYPSNDSGGSVSVDMETAYLLADRADYWLNTGAASTMAQLEQAVPRFMDVPSVRAGRVYNSVKRMSPSGANDYFESGAAAPDRVLADLVSIFHPGVRSDSLYYYLRLQ